MKTIEAEPETWPARRELQGDIADLLFNRYGIQATGGNLHDEGGVDVTFAWDEAAKFLSDLQALEGEE